MQKSKIYRMSNNDPSYLHLFTLLVYTIIVMLTAS